MYHISNDKRSRRSAELIWQGMAQCLQQKSFAKLRVNDIYESSYVSRATFYRLFDSLQDVLAYECDQIYDQLAQAVADAGALSRQDFFLLMIQKWMAQELLIKTLVENNLTHILYQTHMKNRDFMQRIFLQDITLSEAEADYMVVLLANTIPAAMRTWYQHGKAETPQQVLHAVSRSLALINRQLSAADSSL